MTFSIDAFTKAKILDVFVLSQKNRQDDEAPGIQIPIAMKLPNAALSGFDGGLLALLFTKNADDGKNKSGTLEGITPAIDKPNLTELGKMLPALKPSTEISGGAMVIRFATTKIDLDDCTAHSFVLKPQEGGTVALSFKIDAPNASEVVFAKLAKFKSREVEITFVQHEPADDGQAKIDAGAPPLKPTAAQAKQAKIDHAAAATEEFIERSAGAAQ